MSTTEKGRAFLERWQIVEQMAKAGTPIFAAMAAGLEDDDWLIVFAATRVLAQDVHKQGSVDCTCSSLTRYADAPHEPTCALSSKEAK